MAFTRTTTINAAPGGDSVKQGVLDLDTDLTGAFVHLNTLDTTKAPIAKGVTNGDSHDHSGGDGAQIAYSGLSGLPTLGTMSAQNTGTYAGPGSSQAFSVGALTATGINSTPIGSTTPSTGAFTTLSATGENLTHVFKNIATGSVASPVYTTLEFQAYDGSSRTQIKSVDASQSYAAGNIIVACRDGSSGVLNDVATFSSTGLSVTGNLLVNTTTDDGVNKLQVNGSIKATNKVVATGYLSVEGVGNGYQAPSRFGVDVYVSDTRFYASGNNTSNNGTFTFHSTRSDGTNDIPVATFSTTGLSVNGSVWASDGFCSATETFSYNGSSLYHYGLKYIDISGGTIGQSACLSGYNTVHFFTQGQERARISHSGNLLVGTTTDDGVNKLQVNGTTATTGIKFPATQVASSDANTLDDYREGTFTATATGMTTSPTGTATYVRVGNVVTLTVPYITGTSNATTFTLTGMPPAIRPSATRLMYLRVVNNSGVWAMAYITINSAGIINMVADITGASFAATGTKSVGDASVSYII